MRSDRSPNSRNLCPATPDAPTRCLRAQKSLFECQVGKPEWATLRNRLLQEIDPKQDSLRIYHLDEDARERTEHHGFNTSTRADRISYPVISRYIPLYPGILRVRPIKSHPIPGVDYINTSEAVAETALSASIRLEENIVPSPPAFTATL